MTSIKEPCVLVPASELIELIYAYRNIVRIRKELQVGNSTWADLTKYDWYIKQASKNLRRFNRRTMSDS